MAERGTYQDMERNRPGEVNVLARVGGGKNLSEHGNNPTEQDALTIWG